LARLVWLRIGTSGESQTDTYFWCPGTVLFYYVKMEVDGVPLNADLDILFVQY
jgi:hypothetical protein